jgi:hypothetical protein
MHTYLKQISSFTLVSSPRRDEGDDQVTEAGLLLGASLPLSANEREAKKLRVIQTSFSSHQIIIDSVPKPLTSACIWSGSFNSLFCICIVLYGPHIPPFQPVVSCKAHLRALLSVFSRYVLSRLHGPILPPLSVLGESGAVCA